MDERPDPDAPDQDQGIAAYHGSPHDFEQFDLSKIGTGEGAQAYGHGLYFAENENIAKSYRDALTRGAGNMIIEGRPFSEFHGSTDPEKFLKAQLAINMMHDDRDIQQAIDWQIQQTKGKLSSRRLLPEDVEPLMEDIQRLNQMKKSPPKIERNPGHMYEVRINADPDKHFLDWDAPLSEQPEAVRRLAGWTPEWDEAYRAWRRQDADNLFAELEGTGSYAPVKPPPPPAGALRASMRGEELYDHLHNKMGAADWPVDADAATRARFRSSSAARVSRHLMDNGIRGIRYLDASSRGGADQPTRNYVVFDDKHVNVRRKYRRGGGVDRTARFAGGRVNTSPTEAQKEAGNYRKGHTKFQGLDITIENPKDSKRSGVDGGGKRWSVTMPAHYGYIKRTEGADGDHVDVYLGPSSKSNKVFIVDQQDHRTKAFDEHKVMLGYDRERDALTDYRRAFSDGKGGDRIKHVTEMTVPEFKVWLRHCNTKKPVRSRAIVDKALSALSRKA